MYITFYGADLTDCICIITAYCAVPENIHTPPWKALEISGGWGFPKTKKFKEMFEVELEFLEGSGVLIKKKSLLWGGMDILNMELHIACNSICDWLKVGLDSPVTLINVWRNITLGRYHNEPCFAQTRQDKPWVIFL